MNMFTSSTIAAALAFSGTSFAAAEAMTSEELSQVNGQGLALAILVERSDNIARRAVRNHIFDADPVRELVFDIDPVRNLVVRRVRHNLEDRIEDRVQDVRENLRDNIRETRHDIRRNAVDFVTDRARDRIMDRVERRVRSEIREIPREIATEILWEVSVDNYTGVEHWIRQGIQSPEPTVVETPMTSQEQIIMDLF